jgi:hypothetical protein
MGSLTSHNPIGLQGLLRGWRTLTLDFTVKCASLPFRWCGSVQDIQLSPYNAGLSRWDAANRFVSNILQYKSRCLHLLATHFHTGFFLAYSTLMIEAICSSETSGWLSKDYVVLYNQRTELSCTAFRLTQKQIQPPTPCIPWGSFTGDKTARARSWPFTSIQC